MIQLKHALNSRRPTIAKLPPEILAEVFLHHAVIVQHERVALHEERGGAEIHKSFYEWTNVTQVCHHWRNVALKCPHLWTWLAFEERVHSDFTDMIAQRSRKLPLTVILTINSQTMHCDVCLDMDGQYQYPDAACWMLNQKLPRVRELAVFVDREVDRQFAVGDMWGPLVEDSAPMLEDLRIEAIDSTRYRQGASDPAELDVRDGLFNGKTPKLRSLALGGVGIRFANPLFCSSLRTLKISDCQCWQPNAEPDFRAWLHALKRLPRLEVLEVDRSIPSADAGIEYQPVPLPKLKFLHLATTVAAFADHMKYVKLPCSTAVRFSCSDANLLEEVRMSSLRDAISSLFRQMSIYRVSYGTIHPERHSLGHSQLDQFPSCQLWATEEPAPTTDPASSQLSPEGAPPRLTFDSKVDTLNVVLIFSAVDLSRVHTIHVADFASGAEWLHVLKSAPNATILYAHGMAAFGLPSILAGGISDDVDPDPVLNLIQTRDPWFWAAFNTVDTSATPPGADGDEDRIMADATPGADPGLGSNAPLFPSLDTLKFVSLDFLPAAGATVNAHRAIDKDLLAFKQRELEYGFNVETLVKSLHMRRVQGAADIATVDFVDGLCGDMTQLAPLIATVAEVKWDGERMDTASLVS